jgi:hypothetical protein
VGRSPRELALDPTTWKFVPIDIDLLTFWIAHQGAAYPIVWLTLSKAGNSSNDEQITLMEIFIDLFGKDRIKSLTNHREFVGKQWLVWLRNQDSDFRIANRQLLSSIGQFRKERLQGCACSFWRPLRIIDPPYCLSRQPAKHFNERSSRLLCIDVDRCRLPLFLELQTSIDSEE